MHLSFNHPVITSKTPSHHHELTLTECQNKVNHCRCHVKHRSWAVTENPLTCLAQGHEASQADPLQELQASSLNTTAENQPWQLKLGCSFSRDGQPECRAVILPYNGWRSTRVEWKRRMQDRGKCSRVGMGSWQERKSKSKEKCATGSWTPPGDMACLGVMIQMGSEMSPIKHQGLKMISLFW